MSSVKQLVFLLGAQLFLHLDEPGDSFGGPNDKREVVRVEVYCLFELGPDECDLIFKPLECSSSG